MAHAKLSPSKADRWMVCTGSVAACEGYPDKPSKYALEGTAAHTLAAWALEEGLDCEAYLGRIIDIDPSEAEGAPDSWLHWEVTREMAEFVQVYVDDIRRLAVIDGAQMFVELPVDVSHLTRERMEDGEPATGTADAVVLYTEHKESAAPNDGDNVLLSVLHVNDLKFGRGVVVEAEKNRQMLMYASGTLEAIRMMDLPDPDVIRLSIHQPRAGGKSTWDCTMEGLEDFRAQCRAKALLATAPGAEQHLTASEKGCRFCPRKPECEEARRYAQDAMKLDFDDLGPENAEGQAEADKAVATGDYDYLSQLLKVEDFVIDLFKKARARVEAILLGGGKVPGWKVVKGKKGNRAWKDPVEAEAMLKSFRLKTEEMYELSLITPPAAEKLAKEGVIGPKQWKKAATLVHQADGKLGIAPESDRRDAVVIDPAADYDVIEEDFSGLAD